MFWLYGEYFSYKEVTIMLRNRTVTNRIETRIFCFLNFIKLNFLGRMKSKSSGKNIVMIHFYCAGLKWFALKNEKLNRNIFKINGDSKMYPCYFYIAACIMLCEFLLIIYYYYQFVVSNVTEEILFIFVHMTTKIICKTIYFHCK